MLAIRVGNRRFAPSLLVTAAAALGMATFVHLGLWQLDRAEQKRAIQAQFTAGQELTQLTAENAGSLNRYQRIRLQGRYQPQRQVLLDNMPSQHGQPGYRVLTPLRLQDDSTWILIDRGWVPMGRTRQALPDVAVNDDFRTVTGRLDELPQPGMRLTDQVMPTNGSAWPRVLNFPRHEDIERDLQHPVQQRIVRLDPGEPDGYQRAWNPTAQVGPARHIAYSVQWFALAGALLIAYFVVSFKLEHKST
jgi:surfeit locus 1 family protein